MTEEVEILPPKVVGERASTQSRFIGEILGNKYKILRRIGSGGMADVYEVEHVRLASPFAAKVLRQNHDDSVRRFLREARLLAQLRSDHIVTVFDVGDPSDESPFYVMELLHGQDLRRLLAATPELSIERTVKIISDACLGISVAHAAGLVHRDLKPENLFVTHRGSGEEVVKLLDFGVAKANEATSTEHGALIGTVRYMAPEQIEHAGIVNARADVRGLGAILYECLAGRPPHVADSVERLLFKILNEPVGPVGEHRPGVPVELDEIILRALERDPSKRFPSASAFAEALRPYAVPQYATTVDATLPEGVAIRRPKPTRGRAVWLGFAGMGVALLGGFLAFGRAAPHDPTPADVGRRPAETEAPPPPAQAAQTHDVGPTVEFGSAPPEQVAKPVPTTIASAPKPASRDVRRAPANPRAAPAATEPPPKSPLVKIDAKNPYDP